MRKLPFVRCRFNSRSTDAVTYEATVTWYYGYNTLDRDEIQEEDREYFRRRVIVKAESEEEAEAFILKDYPFVNSEVAGTKVLGGSKIRSISPV